MQRTPRRFQGSAMVSRQSFADPEDTMLHWLYRAAKMLDMANYNARNNTVPYAYKDNLKQRTSQYYNQIKVMPIFTEYQ